MVVAIVTGGARGIGAAIARRLKADGASVAILDLEPEDAEPTGADLAVSADVRSLESVEDAVARVEAELGAPTVLVNNAGLTRPGFLHRVAVEDWELVHGVCLQGCFHMLRAVAPAFRDRASEAPRRVVNISSVVGLHGTIGSAAYSAAKAGMIGLTKSMALEWAPFGVTVNAVAPGYIETRTTAAMPPEARASIVERIPLGRAGLPEDVADAVAYLSSPSAGYVTGQVLEVHGGLELVS